MKKQIRFTSLMLSLIMVISLFSGVNTFAAQTEDASTGTVIEDSATVDNVTVTYFRYTPADFEFRGNNTPVLYILSDGAFTKESAEKKLIETGLNVIADEEGAHVFFVSPESETWGEADYPRMQALAGSVSDNYRYGESFEGGKNPSGKVAAGRFRHYIFAEGEAVTFAKTYLDVEGASYFLPEWFSTVDAFGAGYVYEEAGLTKENVLTGWERVRKVNRMFINNMVTFLTPYYYWEEEGITETVKEFKSSYETVGTFEYYMYVPDTVNIDSKTEKYPLVLLFHGGNMHPQAIAQNTAWPIVGRENKFVVVSVNGLYGEQNNEDALAELIDALIKDYAIDGSRVYSTGFSKGAAQSIRLGVEYSEKLAGIAPFDAVSGAGVPENTLPLFWLGGEHDFYDIFPSNSENARDYVADMGKANGFEYTYDETIGGLWGYQFDADWEYEFPEERAVMNVHDIVSADGEVYTKLCDVENMSHNVLPASAAVVWEFLSRFSRNEDGSLNISTVVADSATVGEITVDYFRYTPANFEFRGNNTPVLYVMSDGEFSRDAAEKMLDEKGLRKIADEEGAHIFFVGPEGEAWGEPDYARMQALAGSVSDNYFYGDSYEGGKSKDNKVAAGRFRHYIFAEGEAVNFAKTYLDVEGASYFLPEWFSNVDAFGAGYVYEEEGLTKENVMAGWERVRKVNRMFLNNMVTFLTPYYYWEEEGISETVNAFESSYDTVGTFEYYMYVPDTVDLESETEKYPLVLLFHGNGMHPQAVAQNTTWPIVGRDNDFVVISVNGLYGEENKEDALAEFIDWLVKDYAIDPGRVYASGFSKGALQSVTLGTAYSEKLAGIAPFSGAYAAGEPDYVLPVFTVTGEDDFYEVFPSNSERALNFLVELGRTNGFNYAYDEDIGGLWGYKFDVNRQYTYPEARVVLNVHDIVSNDGEVYTKVCDAENISHNVLPAAAPVVWEFLSRFSRNKDGSITVTLPNPFEDVDRSEWYYTDVLRAADRGLFNGVSETEFRPEGTASRAMLVTVLWRQAGSPEPKEVAGYSDVTEDAWYAKAVAWATEVGVVNGMGNGIFAPEAPVTREQAATMLQRYAAIMSLKVDVKADLSNFEDSAKVSAYAWDAVSWAASVGIINGSRETDGLYLLPQNGTTRAQLAAIMLRFAILR